MQWCDWSDLVKTRAWSKKLNATNLFSEITQFCIKNSSKYFHQIGNIKTASFAFYREFQKLSDAIKSVPVVSVLEAGKIVLTVPVGLQIVMANWVEVSLKMRVLWGALLRR